MIIMATYCSFCTKKLHFYSSEYKCCYCGKVMCSNCIVKVPFDEDIDDLLRRADDSYNTPNQRLIVRSYYLCKSCTANYMTKYNAMQEAKQDYDDIKTVSENYQGSKFDKLQKVKKLQTYYYKSKYDAEEDLKAMAKYLGCTHILGLTFDKGEGEEEGPRGGTHYYTTWSAIGFAAL